MNTVFPVEFELLNGGGKPCPGMIFQGFTRDVSAGGMCIEFKSLGNGESLPLAPDKHLELTINTTFSRHPIKAVSRVVWIKKEDKFLPVRYLIGVAYTEIDPHARQRLIHHAKRLIWVPRAAAIAGILMFGFLAWLFFSNQQLLMENRRLVSELVESAEKKSDVASNIFELQKKKTQVDQELSSAQEKIKNLENSISALTAETVSQKTNYEQELQRTLARQKTLDAELKNLQEGKAKLQTTYETLQAEEKLTASATLKQMVAWLKTHQNLKTGLVASFEGDPALEDWGFTYDQSLVAQVFLLFGDTVNAAQILSFYDSKAETDKGAFYNTYDTLRGSPIERVVHVGPNVWLGIAAVQYEQKTNDGKFTRLAKNIADWTISMQDTEGGVKGGPGVSWYSTEHNLDAYAFFSMLAKQTGDVKYQKAADRVLSWLKKYAYSFKEKRVNRGKGDSTIATDTFSWSIAALGPAVLKAIEFDPEAIMEFAEQNCEVTVSYQQPSGKIAKARGFDFAKAENVGRGGVISTEWTAQVIVTYHVLADYFDGIGNPEKAALYRDKANLYLSELQKLIITSPSRTGQGRGCLPYASMDNVDTGHGWRTPRGRRTGSVAGTAYGIFAWVGYNPFSLENKKELI
jgi:hypothetical protein